MSQPEPFSLGLSDPAAPAPPPEAAPRRPDTGRPDPWRRKAELEAALAAAPQDRALRASYFEHLAQLAGTHSGLLFAVLPELAAPMWFRGGTPDISAMAAAFRDDAFALPGLRATPQRILVIGAYAGYAAVALARRHPRAQLLCAEPLPDNFRLLSLNTTPWRRIRVAQTALWHSATRLALSGRFQADWAVRIADDALDADRTVPAMPPGELVARAGWSHADMVVCDAAGAEREVFSDPLAPWLRFLDVALVRPYDRLAPQGAANVAACFAEETFDHRTQGGFELYERRVPLTAFANVPEELRLLRPEPGGAPFTVQDVAQYGWAFFIFDGSSCQLHPNHPGGKPARAIFPLHLDGQTGFASGLVHAGTPGSAPVVFTARIVREDGTVLGAAQATVPARGSDRMSFALPEGTRGAVWAVLETTLAPGAQDNRMAWARFIDPRVG
jgi:FkbM family methyltransferase